MAVDNSKRGTCLTCGQPARSARAFYCEEHQGNAQKPTWKKRAKAAPAPEPVDLADDATAEASPYHADEVAPSDPAETKKSGGLFGKFWGGHDTDTGTNGHVPSTAERRPASPKRRSSTAAFWGDLIGPASAMVGRAGYVPMARAMQWSSPVAGEIIEDATKGTIVDRMVQPVVRNTEKWEDLFDLIGFWAAIGVAQRDPAHADMAMTFARGRLVNLLPRIASNIRKEREKERKSVEALAELMPDIKELFPDAGPDDDMVGLLIMSLFAPPPEATTTQKETAGVP